MRNVLDVVNNVLDKLPRFFAISAALLTLATIGAGLTMVFGSIAMLVIFDDLSLSRAFTFTLNDRNIFTAIVTWGFSAGIWGLVFPQAILAYVLFFRRTPNFWRRIPLNFTLLTLATISSPVLIAQLLDLQRSSKLAIMLFGPPLGFWLMTIVIFCLGRRTKGSSNIPDLIYGLGSKK